MPLLKPDIQEALRSVGLASEKDASIGERLDNMGLSLDNTLEVIRDITEGGDNSNIRLRAAETLLKLRGVLKEQSAPPPSITIVISDPSGEHTGVNPILLPRQLAAKPPKDSIQ